MRKTFILLIALLVAATSFAFSSVSRSHANEMRAKGDAYTVIQNPPGTRCARLRWEDMEQEQLRDERTVNWRCYRSRPRQGEWLVNAPPKIELKASVPAITLSCKSGEASATCKTDPCQLVTLRANASDAESDRVLYNFSTTGGRVIGDGAEVVWNLNGVDPGTYVATAEATDGCGCVSFAETIVTVAVCKDCTQPPSPRGKKKKSRKRRPSSKRT